MMTNLTERTAKAVKRLAAASGKTHSATIAELLECNVDVFEKLARTLEKAKAMQERVPEEARKDLAEMLEKVEGYAEDTGNLIDRLDKQLDIEHHKNER